MSADEWTEAYENAWKAFYSKENMIKVLARWNNNPKNYWNLMSVFFWYKNAALIEKQHPMIAGFFRLKERTARRPGYAIDSIAVHAWKRARETGRLFVAWAKFLKEMEEVWLQTRKKTEREEHWIEQLQKIQGDVWQALRIGELQSLYANARENLPEKARALLDPLQDLSSKILLSRTDLRRFLKQWAKLRECIHELRLREGEAARHWLDQMYNLQTGIRLNERLNEWHEAYEHLRESLPSRPDLRLVRFDAINNRVVYSRDEVQRVWARTVDNLREMRVWQLRPYELISAFVKDLYLTTSFATTYRAFSKR